MAVACQAKDRVSEAPAEETPSEPSLPREIITWDPEKDDLAAPRGGLRTLEVGLPLGDGVDIVVLFHGYGAHGDDLVPLAERFHQGVPAAYVLPEAPFSLGGAARAWFKRDRTNFDRGLERARALVRDLRNEFPRSEIVLGGFSQGAMITVNLLGSVDERIAGALVLSPADFLPHPPGADSPKPPIFLSHGTFDAVLPFAEGVSLRERLKNLGFEVTWVEFSGTHQIPLPVVHRATDFLTETFR